MEGLQLVCIDGARGIRLIPINVRQRPTVIPLAVVAFWGVIAMVGCDSPPPATAPESTAATSAAASAAPITFPLPPPEALIDVLNRLSDRAVPGADKIGLVELA